MSLETRLSAFERLSSREKTLVVGLGVSILLLATMVISYLVTSALDEAEEAIAYNEEMLADIKSASEPYLAAQANIMQYESMLKESGEKSLRVTISNIAGNIKVKGPAGVDGAAKDVQLSDQILFEKEKTKLIEGPSLIKITKKKKKRNSDEEGSVIRVDQTISYNKPRGQLDKSGVPIGAIYSLLEAIESEPLLFVTGLKIKKSVGTLDKTITKTNDVDIQVTTFRAREED